MRILAPAILVASICLAAVATADPLAEKARIVNDLDRPLEILRNLARHHFRSAGFIAAQAQVREEICSFRGVNKAKILGSTSEISQRKEEATWISEGAETFAETDLNRFRKMGCDEAKLTMPNQDGYLAQFQKGAEMLKQAEAIQVLQTNLSFEIGVKALEQVSKY